MGIPDININHQRCSHTMPLFIAIRQNQEGRASLIAPPKPSPAKPEVAPPSRDKQAAEDAEAAGSAPAGAPRLPTKLKLKAVRHAASAASTTPEPVAQPARHSEQGEAKPGAPPQQSGQQQQQQQQPARAQREQAAATAPAAAAAEEPGKSIKEPVARATISRDKLAALLKQRQAAAAAAAAASGEPGAAAAESSPSEQLQAQRKTPSRAGQPAAVPTVRTAELGVRRDIGAGSDNPADDTHHDHSRCACDTPPQPARLHACLSGCLPGCQTQSPVRYCMQQLCKELVCTLLAYLLACFLASLLACFLACFLASLLACLLACLFPCFFACLFPCLLPCLLPCFFACLLACLLTLHPPQSSASCAANHKGATQHNNRPCPCCRRWCWCWCA
jgi:hypothetical protein